MNTKNLERCITTKILCLQLELLSQLVIRIVSINLIVVLLFNMGGFYLVHKVRQHQIRKEIKRAIKAGVPDSKLIDIIVNSENECELQWHHSREFSYRGTMYDVVRKTDLSDGTVIYHCINDTQETQLFAQLDELVKRASEQTSGAKQTTESSFGILSHILPCSPFQLILGNAISNFHNIPVNLLYTPPALAYLCPPPNF